MSTKKRKSSHVPDGPFVWVRQGKEEHAAHLVMPSSCKQDDINAVRLLLEEQDFVQVKWSIMSTIGTVPASAVRLDQQEVTSIRQTRARLNQDKPAVPVPPASSASSTCDGQTITRGASSKQTMSTTSSGNSACKSPQLKQRACLNGVIQTHEIGDRVHAMWTPTESWHRGTVRGYNELGAENDHERTYHVVFDDGDQDEALTETLCMSVEDYMWNSLHADEDLKGIRHLTNPNNGCLKDRGWHEVTSTGALFASVCDAMRAHDMRVASEQGSATTKEDLNMPDDWVFYSDGEPPVRHCGSKEMETTGNMVSPSSLSETPEEEPILPDCMMSGTKRNKEKEEDAMKQEEATVTQAQEGRNGGGSPTADTAESKTVSDVKLEMFQKYKPQQPQQSVTVQDSQKRQEQRSKSNLTPQGEPRKVFRRGCAQRTIATILGGQGTHPAPTVNNVPVTYFEDGTNPFIQEGEFFFAGRADWNPWTPAFVGDVGFIHTGFIDGRREQDSFHMFLHCSKKCYEPHYHGPEAKGKYLYLGRYRIVPDNADAEIQEVGRAFLYSTLPSDSQWTMADHYRHHEVEINDEEGRRIAIAWDEYPEETAKYFEKARETEELKKEGSWAEMSQDKQLTAACVSMLLDIKHRIEITPVEFVTYDEKLYEKLVEIEAYNGEVATEEHLLGPL